jgi:hypothetical protein
VTVKEKPLLPLEAAFCFAKGRSSNYQEILTDVTIYDISGSLISYKTLQGAVVRVY